MGKPTGAHGFRMFDMVLVIAIIGVVFGLLVPALQLFREAASRSQCHHNLGGMGSAVLKYHDVHKCYPAGAFQASPEDPIVAFNDKIPGTDITSASVHVELLPYVGHKALYDVYVSASPAAPGSVSPVATFVCPSRRAPASAVFDYAPADSPKLHGLGFKSCPSESLFGQPVTLTASMLLNHGSAAHTMLFGHKSMSPAEYATERAIGYHPYGANTRGAFLKVPISLGKDSSESALARNRFSSPHPGQHPIGFGDGSVRDFAYNYIAPTTKKIPNSQPVKPLFAIAAYNGTVQTIGEYYHSFGSSE